MNRSKLSICLLAFYAGAMYAQSKVDFEMMTWQEVKKALSDGKTIALVYNGGTEQRGPQNVNGGHTLMGPAAVIAIAGKLGKAIAAPVMTFSLHRGKGERRFRQMAGCESLSRKLPRGYPRYVGDALFRRR